MMVVFKAPHPLNEPGLSRTERRLLRLAEAGRMTLSTAFSRMHEDESVYYVTDTSLVELMETLSRASPPLLAHSSESVSSHRWASDTVAITAAGRAVLGGGQDRVSLCGVPDRWLGGVHLTNNATLWRWDDARQRISMSRT